LGRVAKQDEGLLGAIKDARTAHKLAILEARKKIEAFVASETEEIYKDLIEAIRTALMDGHSARQIGRAYGSSDPYTIKKLIEEAKLDDVSDGTGDPSWRVRSLDDPNTFELKVVAFGQDRQTGLAVFEVDEDGENITAVDGDFWLQSAVYREGIVEEILNAR
jgi:hypothetical protein|tara:strand:+ start:1116 stop:1604 length:489 start_codon:yes stop_codon:yes gene_type:complete